ncbi:MAG: DNA polymerase III subunit delta [Ruminococcus sp.]|nr:DNA polymerase III subunit delta [Ruminococcus sp.]HRR75535.1 DNA polymerase III subunit delta [Ruminococcus sp.]
MPQTDGKTAEKQIKSGQLSNVYYIYGADVSGVERLTKKLITASVGDNEEFALNKLEGKNLDPSELRDMSEMMPMMSEYNCILVNDFNCEEQREDTVRQVLETIKELPPQTVLIFNVTGFELKTKYDSKVRGRVIADKNKKLVTAIDKAGTVVEFPLKTPAELAKDISASVSARGGAISLDTARELAERCLSDPLMIKNEIDKLCAYADGREITMDMLDGLVHKQSSISVFNLADAVASFNRRLAFEALDELMQDKENRGSVLANITNSFLDLYRVTLARQSGRSSTAVIQDFEYFKRGFAIEKLYKSGQRIGTARLHDCLRILRDTAEKLNSTGGDEKVLLEEMLTEMLMTKNQR